MIHMPSSRAAKRWIVQVRADYQFKKETSPFPLLFDNDIFAVMTCTYTASDFEAGTRG